MTTPNVDLVLVIDASDSMRPCIDQLRRHLRELVKPMQGHVARIRFGLVGLSASAKATGTSFRLTTLAADQENWQQSIDALYGARSGQYELFTEDPDKLIAAMDGIEVSGNEHNLLALDMALDHPWGPSSTTKRVVAMFSDEALEDGVEPGADAAELTALIDKIHRRRVKLFCALPYSNAAQALSMANGSEIEAVSDGQGLASVDFRALMTQMGKSISTSALQGGLDEKHTPEPLFGQDEWVAGSGGWNARDGG